MRKIDLKKERKQFHTALARKPALVDVPKLRRLMIDGQGDPSTSPGFQSAIAKDPAAAPGEEGRPGLITLRTAG